MKLKNKAIFGIMLTLLLITTITSAHSFYLIKASSGTSGPSSSNRLIAVAGSSNGNVYAYNETGSLLWSCYTGADVASVAMSSDGEYIAVGSLANKLYLFSRDGAKLWEKTVPIAYGGSGYGGESKSVAISSDGEYIVAGCTDNLYVYKNDGKLQWSHVGEETCVGIAPNATYIAACNRYDGTLDFFSISSNNPLWSKSIGASWIATSNPGYVIASSSNTAYMFNNVGTQLWSYTLDRGGSVRVDMAEDGLAAVAANDDPGDVACYVWYFNLSGLVWKYTPCPPSTISIACQSLLTVTSFQWDLGILQEYTCSHAMGHHCRQCLNQAGCNQLT